MRKISNASLVLLVLLFLSIFPAGASNINPEIQVDEPFWDFGYIPLDYNMIHYFIVRNTGTSPLHVTKVYSDCNCTRAHIMDTLISPDESSLVMVNFKTTNYYGKNLKSVIIESNDPVSPEIRLEYASDIGVIPPAIAVTPPSLFFLPNSDSKEITLTNKSTAEIKYDIRIEPDSVVKLDKYAGSIDSEKNEMIQVSPSEDLEPGTFVSSLYVIFTKDADTAKVGVPLKIVKY